MGRDSVGVIIYLPREVIKNMNNVGDHCKVSQGVIQERLLVYSIKPMRRSLKSPMGRRKGNGKDIGKEINSKRKVEGTKRRKLTETDWWPVLPGNVLLLGA